MRDSQSCISEIEWRAGDCRSRLETAVEDRVRINDAYRVVAGVGNVQPSVAVKRQSDGAVECCSNRRAAIAAVTAGFSRYRVEVRQQRRRKTDAAVRDFIVHIAATVHGNAGGDGRGAMPVDGVRSTLRRQEYKLWNADAYAEKKRDVSDQSTPRSVRQPIRPLGSGDVC